MSLSSQAITGFAPFLAISEEAMSPVPGNHFEFDVFLCHNSQNKPAVRELKRQLENRRLRVWLDEDEIRPGKLFLPELEKGIRNSASVAVVVGRDGVGPWEDEEMQAALLMAARDKRPVIPVLLPDAAEQPELPLFLASRLWVDLRAGFGVDGLNRLEWAITGNRQGSQANSSHIPANSTPESRIGAPTTRRDEPGLKFFDPDAGGRSHGCLQRDLEKLMRPGEQLHGSVIAGLIRSLLLEESDVEVDRAYDSSLLSQGIRESHEWFSRVRQQEWQLDFATTAVPVLIALTKSLSQSVESLSVILRLYERMAERLRLRLVWPESANQRNELANSIYQRRRDAKHLDDDEVLLALQKIAVVSAS